MTGGKLCFAGIGLQHDSADTRDAATFQPNSPVQWTDGPLLWAPSFWLTTAAYAVVNGQGNAPHVGRVKRCLSQLRRRTLGRLGCLFQIGMSVGDFLRQISCPELAASHTFQPAQATLKVC